MMPTLNHTTSPSAGGRKRNGSVLSGTTLFLLFCSNAISFLVGSTYASSACHASTSLHSSGRQVPLPKERQLPVNNCPPSPKCPECAQCEDIPVCPKCEICEKCPADSSTALKSASSNTNSANPFPETVNRFVVGMAHTTQENFTKTYDLGVPIDRPVKEGDTGVLILYNTPESMPRKRHTGLEPLSALEATQNCDQMNVVLSYHEGRRKQCLAIVPQYESFHIQKWMRVPEDEGRPHHGQHKLRMVPRGHSLSGNSAFHPPHHEKHTKKHWKMLETYLDSIEDVLAELKPIVSRIKKNNAIVVSYYIIWGNTLQYAPLG